MLGHVVCLKGRGGAIQGATHNLLHLAGMKVYAGAEARHLDVKVPMLRAIFGGKDMKFCDSLKIFPLSDCGAASAVDEPAPPALLFYIQLVRVNIGMHFGRRIVKFSTLARTISPRHESV